ncbi:MAG TPA: aminotransferase class I/II-fold pyridoxal phosphate-dependent enzyme [Acidimicrobiia bacterium]|nr:aminotransferase class I/II-fold pyridoxal phosphate-dependent enzyme [Acidimicrobiia bacterium]
MEPPTPSELRRRGGLKWTAFPDDVLAAWVAEMDFGLAPPIGAALHAAVDRHDTGYAYPDIERAAAHAATRFWDDTLGWSVPEERVFPAPDVIEGIRRAIIHLTRPETPVVLHTPVYFPFYSMVERAGRELIDVPCEQDADGRYTLDLAGIDRAFADGAGSVVLCNPWNPTGRSFSRAEIEDLAEVAASYSARIIADEVHSPLTHPGVVHTPGAAVAPDTVVTVTSASKAWNIPGLKCAQVVLTSDRDAEIWSDYFTPDKVGVSNLGLIANAAAYADSRAWLDDVRGRLDANRKLLDELSARHLPRVVYRSPEATYLAWLDFRAYGIDDPAAFFLDEARVAVSAGRPFGRGGHGHARLNFATSSAILKTILERMGSAVGDRT